MADNSACDTAMRNRRLVILWGNDDAKFRIATSILHMFCEERSCLEHARCCVSPCCESCDKCQRVKRNILLNQDATGETEMEAMMLYCEHSSVKVMTTNIDVSSIRGYADKFVANIEDDFDKLGPILFILSLRSFDKEGRSILEKAAKYFGEHASYSTALVITGCEDLTEGARQEHIKEVKTNSETIKFAQYMKMGIIAIGFPDMATVQDKLIPIYTEEIVRSQIELKGLINCADAIGYDDGGAIQKRRTECTCTFL